MPPSIETREHENKVVSVDESELPQTIDEEAVKKDQTANQEKTANENFESKDIESNFIADVAREVINEVASKAVASNDESDEISKSESNTDEKDTTKENKEMENDTTKKFEGDNTGDVNDGIEKSEALLVEKTSPVEPNNSEENNFEKNKNPEEWTNVPLTSEDETVELDEKNETSSDKNDDAAESVNEKSADEKVLDENEQNIEQQEKSFKEKINELLDENEQDKKKQEKSFKEQINELFKEEVKLDDVHQTQSDEKEKKSQELEISNESNLEAKDSENSYEATKEEIEDSIQFIKNRLHQSNPNLAEKDSNQVKEQGHAEELSNTELDKKHTDSQLIEEKHNDSEQMTLREQITPHFDKNTNTNLIEEQGIAVKEQSSKTDEEQDLVKVIDTEIVIEKGCSTEQKSSGVQIAKQPENDVQNEVMKEQSTEPQTTEKQNNQNSLEVEVMESETSKETTEKDIEKEKVTMRESSKVTEISENAASEAPIRPQRHKRSSKIIVPEWTPPKNDVFSYLFGCIRPKVNE